MAIEQTSGSRFPAVTSIFATPRHSRAVHQLQSNSVRLISKISQSREVKTLAQQLGKAAVE
jgi:hypothetical protein